MRPQFTRGQISDLALEEKHVQNLFSRLPIEPGSWTPAVDLVPLFFNLTLDTATEFLFGQSVHSQNISLAEDQSPRAGTSTKEKRLDWSSFGRCFDGANLTITYRSRLMDLYYLYSPRSFQKDCQEVHRFADHYVDLALAEGGEKNTVDSSGKGSYVFLQELAKATRDPDELRSQLLNILLAGRDTTAGLLGWTFYLLARHPDIVARLREAVLDTFGSFSSGNSAISFESLKSCSYLQHVLFESLRLHPVVPENSRRAVKNTTLPRGGGADGQSPIYIRAGEEVVYNVHVMHRRKDIWGPDADEFRPERWVSQKPGWGYVPFNGGPRICLGQQFALTEAGYVIVRMLQRYDKIENLDEAQVTKHKFTSTTSPVEVRVRLHEAPQ